MAHLVGQHDPPAHFLLNAIATRGGSTTAASSSSLGGDGGASASGGGLSRIGSDDQLDASSVSPQRNGGGGGGPSMPAFVVPNSILYTYSKAVAWFYSDETTGAILKRPRSFLATARIGEECKRASVPPRSLPRHCGIRACFIRIAEPPAPREYRIEGPPDASDESLTRFLQASKAHGVLQHFVYPRPATDGSVRSVAIACHFTPSTFVVERLTSRHTMHDKHVPLEQSLNVDTLAPNGVDVAQGCDRQPVKSSLVAEKFHIACTDIARRARLNGVLIKQMSVVCRVDAEDRLNLLYCEAATASCTAEPSVLHIYSPDGMTTRNANAPLRGPLGPSEGGNAARRGGFLHKRRGAAAGGGGASALRHLADGPSVPGHVSTLFAASKAGVAMEGSAGETYDREYANTPALSGGGGGASATPQLRSVSLPTNRSSTQRGAHSRTSSGAAIGGKRDANDTTTIPRGVSFAVGASSPSARPGSVASRTTANSDASSASSTGGADDHHHHHHHHHGGGGPKHGRCTVCKGPGALGEMPRVQKRYLLLTLTLLDRSVSGWTDAVPPSVAVIHPTISDEEFRTLRQSDVWLDEFVHVCGGCVERSNAALDALTKSKQPAPAWLGIDVRYRHGSRQSSKPQPRPTIKHVHKRLEALLTLSGNGSPHSRGRSTSVATTAASSAASSSGEAQPPPPLSQLSKRWKATLTNAAKQLPPRRRGVQQASRVDPAAADVYDTTKGVTVWKRVGFGRPHSPDAYVPIAPVPERSLLVAEFRDELASKLSELSAKQQKSASSRSQSSTNHSDPDTAGDPELPDVDDGDGRYNGEFPMFFDMDRTTGHLPPCTTPAFAVFD